MPPLIDAREIDRVYKRYLQIIDSVPDYINRNLKEMPANKGYIWKAMHLYGHRSRERPFKKTVLFEKLPRGLQKIHEWNDGIYKVYEKIGQQPKTLILTERKKSMRWKPPKRQTKVEDMTKKDFPSLCPVAPEHRGKSGQSHNYWAQLQT